MPTYRSKIAITTATQRRAVYRTINEILEHIQTWGVHMTRIQLMATNFVEVDFTGNIPANQVDHLNLTGPI